MNIIIPITYLKNVSYLAKHQTHLECKKVKGRNMGTSTIKIALKQYYLVIYIGTSREPKLMLTLQEKYKPYNTYSYHKRIYSRTHSMCAFYAEEEIDVINSIKVCAI